MITVRVDRLKPGSEIGALRTKTFRWLLKDLLQLPAGTTLVDLGAGPCKFSQIARDLGLKATAVDVRDERLPQDLDDIAFVKSDVRAYNPEGFNVVCIIGLLYHLTLEDQIDLLTRCPVTSTIIIDTQIHVPDLVVREANRDGFADRIVTEEPYTGVLYPELNNPMASWGNKTSFWHTEASLLSLLENTGRSWVRIIDPPYISKYGARSWLVASAA
jgi:hypothetical protein